MRVSGMSRDSVGMRERASDADKRPSSPDLGVTRRRQILSLSLTLITALDPNCEFHLQTARFDEQMFVQLRKSVRAERFQANVLLSLRDARPRRLLLYEKKNKMKSPSKVFYCADEM